MPSRASNNGGTLSSIVGRNQFDDEGVNGEVDIESFRLQLENDELSRIES